ncbi:MAG: hypothetical protein QY332_14690 [Anaerolineales bacterium]|nr:MAG: hypothetical protein QY332_14690 [Anaerolineales bacterium]
MNILSIIINSVVISFIVIDTILVIRYWRKDGTISLRKNFPFDIGLGFRLFNDEMKGRKK